ncbi:MAG: hypothetical protein JWM76_3934, partial [Pseudonocardiales bacterium]|nr:hypothetical protein [Pseudonocardiales bacterium]
MRRPELDHVGIAVEDLGAVARMFIDGLGGTLIGG